MPPRTAVAAEVEGIFLAIHQRIATAYVTRFSASSRRFLEFLSFAAAVGTLSLLVFLHVSFVTNASCLQHRIHATNMTHVEVLRIRIQSEIGHIATAAYSAAVGAVAIDVGGDVGAVVAHAVNEAPRVLGNGHVASFVRSLDAVYEYSRERGFLMLGEDARLRRGVVVGEIVVRSGLGGDYDACVGGPLVRAVLECAVSFDSAVLSAVIGATAGPGYVLSQSTGETFFLGTPAQRASPFSFKANVVGSAFFLFFATTTLVALVLRETQLLALQQLSRQGFPIGFVLVSHTYKSLCFLLVRLLCIFACMNGPRYMCACMTHTILLSVLLLTNLPTHSPASLRVPCSNPNLIYVTPRRAGACWNFVLPDGPLAGPSAGILRPVCCVAVGAVHGRVRTHNDDHCLLAQILPGLPARVLRVSFCVSVRIHVPRTADGRRFHRPRHGLLLQCVRASGTAHGGGITCHATRYALRHSTAHYGGSARDHSGAGACTPPRDPVRSPHGGFRPCHANSTPVAIGHAVAWRRRSAAATATALRNG
eukprot:Opistho-2@46975